MEEKKIRHFKKPKRKTCARAREKLLAKRAVLSNTRHTRTFCTYKEREERRDERDDRALEAEKQKETRETHFKNLSTPPCERAHI